MHDSHCIIVQEGVEHLCRVETLVHLEHAGIEVELIEEEERQVED